MMALFRGCNTRKSAFHKLAQTGERKGALSCVPPPYEEFDSQSEKRKQFTEASPTWESLHLTVARLYTQVDHIPDTAPSSDAVKAELAGANHGGHTEGLRMENSKGNIGRTAVGSGPTMTRHSHGFYILW